MQQADEFDVHPLPYRLPAFSTVAARALHARDDVARPARHPRSRSAVPRVSGHAAGFDLRLAARAAALGELAGDRLPRASRRPVPLPAGARAAISRALGAFLPRRASTGDRDRAPRRHPDQDRGEGGQGRPGLLRPGHRAAPARPARRLRRRDRRRRQGRVPRQCAGAAVSDRLAGAVRPRDDRGDGVRHAGDRVWPRFGARGHAGGRHRFHRMRSSTMPCRRCGGVPRVEPRALSRSVRGALHRGAHGARLPSTSTSGWRRGRRSGLRNRERRWQATSSGSRTASTSCPRRAAWTTGRACSSRATRSRIFDRSGDVEEFGTGVLGLYHHDTRFLSTLVLRLAGERPLLLSSTIKEDNAVLAVDLMNPDIRARGRGHDSARKRARLPLEGAVGHRVPRAAADPQLRPVAPSKSSSRSNSTPISGTSSRCAARTATRRGQRLETELTRASALLSYEGLDHCIRGTQFVFDPPPAELTATQARYVLRLAPRGEASCHVEITCAEGLPADASARQASLANAARSASCYEDAATQSAKSLARARAEAPVVVVSNERFNEWLNRSVDGPLHDGNRHAARAISVRRRAVVQHGVRPRRHHQRRSNTCGASRALRAGY